MINVNSFSLFSSTKFDEYANLYWKWTSSKVKCQKTTFLQECKGAYFFKKSIIAEVIS